LQTTEEIHGYEKRSPLLLLLSRLTVQHAPSPTLPAPNRTWPPAGDKATPKGWGHPAERRAAHPQPRGPSSARGAPTVMRMQWRSRGSPDSSLGPTMAASLATSFTRTMSMSFSQQKAWMRVKWICRAMSPSSSSSAASTQKATLSGSLQQGERRGEPPRPAPKPPSGLAGRPPPAVLTRSSAWPTRRRRR